MQAKPDTNHAAPQQSGTYSLDLRTAIPYPILALVETRMIAYSSESAPSPKSIMPKPPALFSEYPLSAQSEEWILKGNHQFCFIAVLFKENL